MKKKLLSLLVSVLLLAALLPATVQTAFAQDYDRILSYQVDVTPSVNDGSLAIRLIFRWKALEDLPAANSQQGGVKIGIPNGSIGETSVIAIALGAIILLVTGIGSFRTMFSVFLGGALMAVLFSHLGMTSISWYEHLALGGFCFGAVFMATDPVTSARTTKGQYIYGFLIGVLAVIIRVMNPGYPEGMMLAILFMNMFAPLIDYCVVQRNISARARRAQHNK